MKKPIVTADVVADMIPDGASLMVAGFGGAGTPNTLLAALTRRRPRSLTIVANNAGVGRIGIAELVMTGAVERVICSYPAVPGAGAVLEVLAEGSVDLKIVPQGTLAERIRAAGAGLGGVLSPTGVGTAFADERQAIEVGGTPYLVEPALHADFAFVHAAEADEWGNLRYRYAANNFSHVMAMAGATTFVEYESLDPDGLEPETIHTPGIFVDYLTETDA